MTVEIRILADTASEAREEMARLFGSVKMTTDTSGLELGDLKPGPIMSRNQVEAMESIPAKEPEEPSPETPFREFGKAPEGKTRRTKEEIAEDEELAALAEKYGATTEWLEKTVRQLGHAGAEAELKLLGEQEIEANISASPEDRQDPENPADAEQDAADEQAEVDAVRDPEAPLTLDDLRSAMNEFVEAKGMPTTQKEGPSIFEKALGKPPAGEAAWKLSLLSEATQEQLKAAIAAWKEAAGA